MIQDNIIQQALKDSDYHLSLFSEDEIIALRRKVATRDVIVSSIEGSLLSIAFIEKEYDQAFVQQAFMLSTPILSIQRPC
jgi:hypothetical protein